MQFADCTQNWESEIMFVVIIILFSMQVLDEMI